MPIQIGAQTHNFDHPTGLLSDCHRRVEMFLGILERAQMLGRQEFQHASDTQFCGASLCFGWFRRLERMIGRQPMRKVLIEVKSAFARHSVCDRLIFAYATCGSRTAKAVSRENRGKDCDFAIEVRSLQSGLRGKTNGNLAELANCKVNLGGNSLQSRLSGGEGGTRCTSVQLLAHDDH